MRRIVEQAQSITMRLYELKPITSRSYYKLTDAGLAGAMLPRILIAGEGFAPTQDQ